MVSQPNQEIESRCSRCGKLSAGRFCTECGAPLRDAARHSQSTPVKVFAITSILVIAAFLAGESAGRASAPPARQAVEQSDGAAPSRATDAPDISTMSPEERASRLFNRVMSYSERGQRDSARLFAPMAIQAYRMIGPPDAHARYDIGSISIAVGDPSAARAEADTILAAQPSHLLGLVLAIHAADLAGDPAGAARFRRRLVAAAPAERAKGLKEYDEHARDIDNAVTKASAAR